MANQSIYKAFERMWAHVVNALSGKANKIDLDSLSEEVDGCITELSVSGKTVTYTKNDGTTGTITTQDTDTKVTQGYNNSSNKFPLLMSATPDISTAATRGSTTTVLNNSIYAVPSSGTIYATTFSGTATKATSATKATNATNATNDANGNNISTTYETKSAANSKLSNAKSFATSEAATASSAALSSAKTYADSILEAAKTHAADQARSYAESRANAALTSAKNYADSIKNDLLNGAGEAYDTLKELGDLIDENVDAIEALEVVATNKVSINQGVENAYKILAIGENGMVAPYSITATDDEVLNALIEIGALSAVSDNDGSIITDENNNILMW